MLFLREHIENNNKIAETFYPLIEKLKANYVSYSKLLHDGKLQVCTTDPDYLEHLFKRRFRLATVSADSGIHVWKENRDKFLFVNDAREFFDHDHGVTIIKKQEDSIITFSIAAERSNTQFIPNFISELEFFGKFYNHFIADINHMLHKRNVGSVLVPKEMLLVPGEQQNQDSGMNLSRLTHKEKQIVSLVANGKTAKQIGKELNISNRTVEMHIQNARQKYKCKNKVELAQLFLR